MSLHELGWLQSTVSRWTVVVCTFTNISLSLGLRFRPL
jgi:hypothetical protein